MLCHYFTLAVILLYRCDAESHINAKIKYICVKTINNGNGLNDSLKGITKSLELEKWMKLKYSWDSTAKEELHENVSSAPTIKY